jgi:hypothetical protein
MAETTTPTTKAAPATMITTATDDTKSNTKHSLKRLPRRKKSIGRRKDGSKVKRSTYNYTSVRVLYDLPPSAPPQQVSLAVMTDQLEDQGVTSVPLKSSIGRRKDGSKVKRSTYNYTSVRVLYDLPPSAPSQQVSSAVMTDQLEDQGVTSVPLKSGLERNLKIAQSTILKRSDTIQHLKKDNRLQSESACQRPEPTPHREACSDKVLTY